MKPVERNEIVDYATYEDERNAFRAEVMNIKAPRRVHIGDYITLLFENHTTIRYQIQEMVRAERMVRESDTKSTRITNCSGKMESSDARFSLKLKILL